MYVRIVRFLPEFDNCSPVNALERTLETIVCRTKVTVDIYQNIKNKEMESYAGGFNICKVALSERPDERRICNENV